MVETTKITTIINFECKKLIGRSKHRNKKRSEKGYVEKMLKDIPKIERHCSNEFCRISKKIRRFREQESLLWPNSTKWTS